MIENDYDGTLIRRPLEILNGQTGHLSEDKAIPFLVINLQLAPFLTNKISDRNDHETA